MINDLKLVSNENEFKKNLSNFFKNKYSKGYCCVINANILVECYRNNNYFHIVKDSVFSICDGINVRRIYNITQKAKIKLYPGPNMFNDLVFKNNNYNHFFLGGKEDVLHALKRNIISKKNRVNENSFYSPPFLPVEKFNYEEIAKKINLLSPDIIWIGLGAPKQEKFMHNLLPFLDRGLMIGVGAAFNFYSGVKKYKRAPLFMQRLHLEWMYRAFQEPDRIIKRQLKNLCFLPVILANEYK